MVGLEQTENLKLWCPAPTDPMDVDKLSDNFKTLDAAVRGGSNPNLLDNWYFADPINQLGQKEYSSIGYSIDRWINESSDCLRVEDDGIVIENEEIRGQGHGVSQTIEKGRLIPGYTYTLSALVSELNGSALITFYGKESVNIQLGINSLTFVFTGEEARAGAYPVANLQGTIKLIAAKLEPGTQQTLAHQDADGNWVLNDPPPNKALELAKCQRYQYNPLYNATGSYNRVGHGISGYGNLVLVLVPLPTSMRIAPTIKNLSNLHLMDMSSGKIQSVESITVDGNSITAGSINIICKCVGTVSLGEPFILGSESDAGTMLLDANL